jgi:lipopolysaccharide assembly protein A
MGTYVKWIVIIIILLFFITFGVQNSQTVYLNYYFNIQGLELPLYGLVFISILLGIVAGMIIGVTDRLIVKRKLKEREAEIRELEERIAGQQESRPSHESHFEEKTGE